MSYIRCLLSVLLLVMPAAAQVKGPEAVTLAVGEDLAVQLTADADEVKVVVLATGQFKAVREFTDPKTYTLQIFGKKAGTGYVVVSATKGGKLLDPLVVKVAVTGDRFVPMVNISPPSVADEAKFLEDLKVAVALDPAADRVKLPALSLLYFSVIKTAASGVTWGELFADMQTKAEFRGLDAVLPNTHAAIREELARLLPAGKGVVTVKIDAAGAKIAEAAFTKVYRAIDVAARDK